MNKTSMRTSGSYSDVRPRFLVCADLCCPHERQKWFSDWVRAKLPKSRTGFAATDLDFILLNWKTKKVMLLEIKTNQSKPAKFQRGIFGNLHKWIQQGIDADWEYLGFNLVTFEHFTAHDGWCKFNDEIVTEPELIERLSF